MVGGRPALQGLNPSSWAEVVGNLQYFSWLRKLLDCELLASRRIISGWHAAFMADLDMVSTAQPAVDLRLSQRKARRLELGGGPGSLFLPRFYLEFLWAQVQVPKFILCTG